MTNLEGAKNVNFVHTMCGKWVFSMGISNKYIIDIFYIIDECSKVDLWMFSKRVFLDLLNSTFEILRSKIV
jgi:hypothetical protein